MLRVELLHASMSSSSWITSFLYTEHSRTTDPYLPKTNPMEHCLGGVCRPVSARCRLREMPLWWTRDRGLSLALWSPRHGNSFKATSHESSGIWYVSHLTDCTIKERNLSWFASLYYFETSNKRLLSAMCFLGFALSRFIHSRKWFNCNNCMITMCKDAYEW